MVAFNLSNLVPCNTSRARPRVQGGTFATVQGPLLEELSLERIASKPQGLLGNSPTSHKRLHRADHSNQQFSVLAISNASGAVVERVAYQAYGQPTFTNAAGTTLSASVMATRYSYTGREWDAFLKLNCFRERWISCVSGRFIGRDPIGFRGGINTYGDRLPLAATDAFGLWPMIVQPRNSWDWYDFAAWYFIGQGRAIDLGRVGLIDEFKRVHHVTINNLKNEAMQTVFDEMEECTSRGTHSTTKSGLLQEGYLKLTDRYSPMGILGEGQLRVSYTCKVSYECDDCGCPEGRFAKSTANVSCDLAFSIRDAFSNPDDWHGAYRSSDTYGLGRCRGLCQSQRDDCIRSSYGDRGTIGYCQRELQSCRSNCDRSFRDPKVEYPFGIPYSITADWTDKSSAEWGDVEGCRRGSGVWRR